MTNRSKTNNLNYLIDSTFNKDYLFRDLKMKMIGLLFQSIMHQRFFWCSTKKQRRNIRKDYWNEQKL